MGGEEEEQGEGEEKKLLHILLSPPSRSKTFPILDSTSNLILLLAIKILKALQAQLQASELLLSGRQLKAHLAQLTRAHTRRLCAFPLRSEPSHCVEQSSRRRCRRLIRIITKLTFAPTFGSRAAH